jgi:hypothetical protein
VTKARTAYQSISVGTWVANRLTPERGAGRVVAVAGGYFTVAFADGESEFALQDFELFVMASNAAAAEERCRTLGRPALSPKPALPASRGRAKPSSIRRIIEGRGVSRLVHFTRLENLASIATDGALHSRAWLEERGRSFVPTDADRLDGRHSVNLSIEFPNYQMFFSKRRSLNLDERHWAVLVFEPRLMWERPCAFSPTNAASSSISSRARESLMSEVALLDLFRSEAETRDGRSVERETLGIPSSYCTDPQAEVLVQGTVSLDYLQGVAVYDASVAVQSSFPAALRTRARVVTELFKPRKDWDTWTKQSASRPTSPTHKPLFPDDDFDIPF